MKRKKVGKCGVCGTSRVLGTGNCPGHGSSLTIKQADQKAAIATVLEKLYAKQGILAYKLD